MGDYVQADFITEILAGLGNRTDLDPERIVNLLNLSQTRLARAYDFLELQQFIAISIVITGDPAVDKTQAIPPNTKTIHSLTLVDRTAGQGGLANSGKMIEKPWRWFDENFPVPDLDAPGWPRIYTRWGPTIEVYPTPLDTYNLRYRISAWPTLFDPTQPLQASDFMRKDDILIDLTLHRIFRSLGPAGAAMANEYLQSAIQSTKEAISRENTRPDMDISSSSDFNVPSQYWSDPFIKGVYS